MQSVWYHNSFVDEPTWSSTNAEFSKNAVMTPVTPSRKRGIDGNNHCNVFEQMPKRRPCSQITAPTLLTNSQSNTGFREKLVPEEEDDLPVHPKKIAEGVRVGSKTLLLTGPCGSGKTTAVKVLCAELGIELLEFDGDQEYQVSYNGDDIYEKSMLQTFYQFMSNAECSSLEKMSLKQRLLLIKQLPNIFYRDQEILRRALRSCASFSRCMIVFVLASSEASWELNPSRLFSSATMDEFKIQQIKFNAISATQMTRVIRSIVGLLGVKMDKTEDIKRIVSLANGDLRKTLNMMEFFAIGRSFSLSLLASADAHFDLFHFIGKIMYAKRATNSTDSWTRSEEKLLPKARRKMRMFPPKEDLNELTDSNFVSGNCLFDSCFSGDMEIYPLLDKYMFEVATRSAIYHNYQDSSTGSASRKGLYQFGKPKFKPVIERRDAKERIIRAVFPCFNICEMKMLGLFYIFQSRFTADRNSLETEEMQLEELQRIKSRMFPEQNTAEDYEN